MKVESDYKIHRLKILPKYLDAILRDEKRFELRKDDRDFQVGDKLVLEEHDGSFYTGKQYGLLTIKYILRDCPEYGLAEGYCILGW